MEHKNYMAIAEEMRKALENTTGNVSDLFQWARCAHAIASAMKSDNPNYDYDEFMNACGWAEVFGKEYQYC